MSDSNDGTASGDYDNETAGLIEKQLDGKRAKADATVSADDALDESEESLEIWEEDGGRRCDEPPTSGSLTP